MTTRAPGLLPYTGFRNLLINPHGQVNQRGVASAADTAFAWDRWRVRTQTAAVGISTITDAEDGSPSMMRLTQSQVAAQRMGIAQVIEGRNCKHLHGKAAVLSGRVRYSNAAPIRYAILEHTGTEDAPPADVVNSWTNGTFTAGNFFIASNLTVRAVGTQTPAANTLTDIPALSAILGSTFNNLIAFIWTEGTAAQTSTLDLSLQFEQGTAPTTREFRPIGIEEALCARYCQTYMLVRYSPLAGQTQAAGNWTTMQIPFAAGAMRLAPTATATAALDYLRDGAGTAATTVTVTAISTTTTSWRPYGTYTGTLTTHCPASIRCGASDSTYLFDAEL